jgi:hypothetical protein
MTVDMQYDCTCVAQAVIWGPFTCALAVAPKNGMLPFLEGQSRLDNISLWWRVMHIACTLPAPSPKPLILKTLIRS